MPLKARVQVRNRVGISHSIFYKKSCIESAFSRKGDFYNGSYFRYLLYGYLFHVLCYLQKMSAEINDLRKKADDYYDAICLLKEECNPVGQSAQQDTVENVDNIEA